MVQHFVCKFVFVHVLISLVPEPQLSLSDSEEEIDFGFWEKASSLPSDKTHTTSQPTKELDLNLLMSHQTYHPCMHGEAWSTDYSRLHSNCDHLVCFTYSVCRVQILPNIVAF